MKKEFIIGVLLGFILMSATCQTREESQEIMSAEAEKQTALMQQQVDQLSRIANALEKDTTKVKLISAY
jgi:CHASE1-domain containing sensor protein